LALTVAFTAVAGFVDAIGFLRLNGLFLGFMSGNSTRFAVAVARMRWAEAGRAGGVVLLFVAGVVVGTLIGRAAAAWRRPAILAGEAMLLVLGMALGRLGFAGAVPLVLAMGVQNAALQRSAGQGQRDLHYRDPGPTRRGARRSRKRAAVELDALCASMGRPGDWRGACGAVAYLRFGLPALAAPAGAALVLGALLAPRARSASR